jgi:antirestriction protein ArdC
MSNKQQTEIVELLINALENSTAPWMKPWEASQYQLCNGVTGHKYQGINIIMLSLNSFIDPRYCTFNQAQERGWKIKKGSRSSLVKYSGMIIKEEMEYEEALEGRREKIFINKWFRVFNFEQIEGVSGLEDISEKDFVARDECEAVLKNIDIEVRESVRTDRAYYSVDDDCVYVPNRGRFINEIEFYKTVFHELGHATGAEHRLNREKGKIFGDKEYAFEELVAEITSFLVGQVVGCGSAPSENDASYLKNWLAGLRNDKGYIFKACRLADQAMQWILYPEQRNNLKNKES